jgi:hypothetical protein
MLLFAILMLILFLCFFGLDGCFGRWLRLVLFESLGTLGFFKTLLLLLDF